MSTEAFADQPEPSVPNPAEETPKASNALEPTDSIQEEEMEVVDEFDESDFDEDFDDDFEEEIKGEYDLEDDQYGEDFNTEFGHLTPDEDDE